ncbi:MAG: molybdenum cofactor guanylyltransferase [Nitrospirota bacterium]|nr:molybdenum cofactor guanylyltransferase [Nitrospirota bacterium]
MDAMILAGGENRRFLFHKGLAEVHGKKIIEIISGILRKNFNKVWISTNSPEKFFYLGLPMVGDIINARGPLTGIFSVLSCTGVPEIFVAACDMPFISDGIVSLIRKSYRGQDAVVPVFDGRPQPLLGIYSNTIKDVIEEGMFFKSRAMKDLLNAVDVYYIDEQEVLKVDPEGKSFTNINTWEDLRQITGG